MTPGFDDVHGRVAHLEGWLRPEQARRLWELAAAVPEGGTIVEIGSYQGKSTVILAAAARPGVTVYAIDPHAGNDRGPGEWDGDPADGQSDHEIFMENLEANGVRDRVTHVREFSQDAHSAVPGAIDLLYVDGAHGYAPASSDITGWGDRVRVGGSMAIHDVYTSFFVSLAVARHLWVSSTWHYLGRERSMAFYRRTAVPGSQRLPNAARQAASVPWFVKNMAVKTVAAAGLERIADLGRHRDGGLY